MLMLRNRKGTLLYPKKIVRTLDTFPRSTLFSPTSTNTSIETNITKLVYQLSPLSPDYLKDRFSPTTYEALEGEIRRNAHNLEDLNEICKNKETKESINENLLHERKYLLEQKSKHLNSILQESSKVPLNETDIDSLCKDISNLKANVDNLSSKSENLRYRSLEDNKDNSLNIKENKGN